jgi:hypothetical protein
MSSAAPCPTSDEGGDANIRPDLLSMEVGRECVPPPAAPVPCASRFLKILPKIFFALEDGVGVKLARVGNDALAEALGVVSVLRTWG